MTTRELLNRLPPRIARRAIANASYPDWGREGLTLDQALLGAFDWARSPEGHEFWNETRKAVLGERKSFPRPPRNI